jgi:hypothetical protein
VKIGFRNFLKSNSTSKSNSSGLAGGPSFKVKIKVKFFWFGRRPHSGHIVNDIATFALREVVASRTSKHGRRAALRRLFFRKAGKRD